MLHAENLGITLNRRHLIRDLNASFAPGRVHALLGPNGAGKSTLLRVLAGLQPLQVGRVSLDGRALQTWRPAELARRRALLPQEHMVAFEFKVAELVRLGRYPHGASRDDDAIVQQALERVDLAHLGERLFQTLSGGEKARAMLARALVQVWHPPTSGSRWLLLDEPTAALDVAHQHAVVGLATELAHEQGVGVIVVLHDLNLAWRYADEVIVLRGGRHVASGPTEATLTPTLVEDVWQVHCQRVRLGTSSWLALQAAGDAALHTQAIPRAHPL